MFSIGKLPPATFALSKPTGMYFKTLLLSLFLGLTLALMAGAQPSQTDSLAFRLELRWLETDLQQADIFHQMEKYKLAREVHPESDSVFYPAWLRYEKLYAKLPQPWRPAFFSEAFYELAVPVAQYFRNAAIVSTLMEHAAALHPRPEAPDPKHPHEGRAGHHNHQ